MVELSNVSELKQSTQTFSGSGVVYSYTVVNEAPEGYEGNAPYILALVKLDDGPIVTAQLTDIQSNVTIGERVEMVTRKLTTEGPKGMIVYGYKFRPLIATSA